MSEGYAHLLHINDLITFEEKKFVYPNILHLEKKLKQQKFLLKLLKSTDTYKVS